MIESASLVATKCENALSGIGVGAVIVVPLLDPPPPPPPLVPSPVVVPEPERVVPPCEVVALDEILVEVLVLESTVEFAVEPVDSADVEFTLEAPVVEPLLDELRAELEDTGADTPDVALGLSSEPPATAPALAPAPLDEPAVLEAVAATVPVPPVVACT